MKQHVLDDTIIEYLGYWEGDLVAGRLAALRNVNRQHAQTHMIGPYERDRGGDRRLVKEGRRKTFATEDGAFVAPAFIGTSPADFLQINAAVDVMTRPHRGAWKPDWKGHIGPAVHVEAMPSLETLHKVHEPFRALHSACARRVALILRYRSRTSDHILMRVSPHAIVAGGDRLHFRCYVEENFGGVLSRTMSFSSGASGYWSDIVPYRVLRLEGEEPKSYIDGGGDAAWRERTTLRFRLDDTLSPGIRDAIIAEHDGIPGFDFPNLKIQGVRKAVAPYVARKIRWRVFDENEGPVQVWIPENGEKS
jgi:hypothetical protein